MAITDLTNTTWYVPSGWYLGYIGYCIIDGTLNYSGGTITLPYPTRLQYDMDDERIVLSFSSWDNNIVLTPSDSFTLSFLTHVPDANFEQFLITEGTQLKVTDLTDTTWTVASGWEAEAGYGQFNVNASVNEHILYAGFKIGYYSGWDDDSDWYKYVAAVNRCCSQGENFYSDNSLLINITGGNDTTNPKLIAWLSKYGELQGGEVEPTLTYDLSQLDLPEGTHSITVVAKADGYSNSAPSNAVEYVVESNLISFTIEGTPYQAEEGMTWAEWRVSEYNTGGYYEEYGNSIYRGTLHAGTAYRVSTDGTVNGVVKPDEYITAGAYEEYAYTSSGGGAD